MSASKTKKKDISEESASKHSVQLIVFSPVNSDPDDEDNRIYMVCPSSLKVVEVVEKYDNEAQEYIRLLGKKNSKKKVPVRKFIDELGEDEVDEVLDTIEDGDKEDLVNTIDEEVDDELVAFVGNGMTDIFPEDENDDTASKASDIDLAEAIAILDQEDTEEDLKDLDDFKNDEDELPVL